MQEVFHQKIPLFLRGFHGATSSPSLQACQELCMHLECILKALLSGTLQTKTSIQELAPHKSEKQTWKNQTYPCLLSCPREARGELFFQHGPPAPPRIEE